MQHREPLAMRTFASFSAAILFATLPLAAQTTTTTKHVTHAKRTTHTTHRTVHTTAAPALITRPVAPTPAVSVATIARPLITPAPYAQNPINQLRGNARVLLVFAPDSATPALHQQMLLLDHHELEFTERNTVLISEVTQRHTGDDFFPGENFNAGTPGDQLSARLKFGLGANDFAVVLLDQDGHEQFRSRVPISAADLAAQIDSDSPDEGQSGSARAGR